MEENRKKPQVRFDGYTDDWEQRKLGDEAIEMVAGGDIDKSLLDEHGKYPVIANALTDDGIVGYYASDYRIKAPAVTVTGRGDVGHAKARTVDFTPVVRLLSVRSKHDVFFLENAINTLNVIVESTGVPQLTVPQLSQYEIFFPPTITEEKEIGAFFDRVDNLITLHQRKHNKLVDVKKSMLEKMFPKNGEKKPEIRFGGFTDDWEQRKLGEYVSITSGEAPSKFEEGTELYVKVDDLNYNDKYVVDTQNKVAEHSTVKRVTKGSVVFPKRGAAIMTNKVRIMGIDSYMDTNMMALTSEKLDSEFLYNIISKEGLYKIADTSTIPQINNKHIEPYEVTIPSLDEQRRIGAYFRSLDHLITLHQREVEKLKNNKKSMLEKMFI